MSTSVQPPVNSRPGIVGQQSVTDLADQQLVNNFEIPIWAGKPPTGLHLDVLKEGKLIQKLMIDEKKCFFFGRNRQLCDFPIEHASSSRVHAALVWHRALQRPFLIDLGSTHGTFIGEHIRLEPHKPQQIPPDAHIHFGASQRIYVVKERPVTNAINSSLSSLSSTAPGGTLKSGLTGTGTTSSSSALELPEDETELDNLTEYNTAHNRRIASLPISDQSKLGAKRLRRKFKAITFCEEEQIINPEDIDPNIGRFRNLCRTVVVPSKRPRIGSSPLPGNSIQFFGPGAAHAHKAAAAEEEVREPTHHHLPPGGDKSASALSVLANPLYSSAAKLLNIPMPNLAPSLDEEPDRQPLTSTAMAAAVASNEFGEALYPGLEDEFTDLHGGVKHKKYAKEAWPGKKPTGALLV